MKIKHRPHAPAPANFIDPDEIGPAYYIVTPERPPAPHAINRVDLYTGGRVIFWRHSRRRGQTQRTYYNPTPASLDALRNVRSATWIPGDVRAGV